SNPPFVPLTKNDMLYHPFPYEYPADVLKEKMKILTETIRERFNRSPLTFRAGRYGIDKKLAKNFM
ncbi:MAG: deacetylase, partial [Promethearchaeota archaeon]